MNYDKEIIFAYLEEDNIQRAYFRVKPLLTASGDVQEEARQCWPEDGALRIVPDKNEQFYFKDRMRTLGSYCAVDLTPFPADANKIRTNKNFRPDRDERNQFILYSDAVKALPEAAFLQVFKGSAAEFSALAADAVTPFFCIQDGAALLGPVSKAAPECPTTAAPEGTQCTVVCPDGTARTILCTAQAVKPASAVTVQPKPIATPVPFVPVQAKSAATPVPFIPAQAKPAVMPPTPVQPKPMPPQPVKPMPKPAAPSATEELPIGKPLTILDANKDFKETLQDIAQPLSQGANLLHQRSEQPSAADMPKQTLSGTPLYRTSGLRTAMPRPKNQLQEVVANQWRAARNEPPANPLPSGATLRTVENPVEKACTSMREAWQVPEAQSQLVDFILSLPDMNAQLERRLSAHAGTTALQKVLLTRLQDLEADHLTVLVQLDKAHADLDSFRKTALSDLRADQRAELDKTAASVKAHEATVTSLKQQVAALEAQRSALIDQVDTLSHDTLPATLAKAMAQAQLVAPVNGIPLRLNAVTGQSVPVEALIEQAMSVCQQDGITCSRNAAVALLALLAVCPRIGLVTPAPAPLTTLTAHLSAAFGWSDGCKQLLSDEQRPLVTPLPIDSTPLLLFSAIPSYTPMADVTKLLSARTTAQLTQSAAYALDQWPIMTIPTLRMIDTPCPKAEYVVSAASLAAMRGKHAATQAEVLSVMKPLLACVAPLSGKACAELVAFAACSAAFMERGLADACDWAALLWIIPAIDHGSPAADALRPLLDEFPRALSALQ